MGFNTTTLVEIASLTCMKVHVPDWCESIVEEMFRQAKKNGENYQKAMETQGNLLMCTLLIYQIFNVMVKLRQTFGKL